MKDISLIEIKVPNENKMPQKSGTLQKSEMPQISLAAEKWDGAEILKAG